MAGPTTVDAGDAGRDDWPSMSLDQGVQGDPSGRRRTADRRLPGMDERRADRQLGLIGEVVAIAADARVEVWLRGGWAMDFFLGEVTRDHVDIDWFAWAADALVLRDALLRRGYQLVDGPPMTQQLDVARDGEELSFAWLARDEVGHVVVGGGPWAGAPYPSGMLDWPPARLGQVCCPIISPAAQIEIKQMMPVWVPGRPRRAKDAADLARLRAALHDRDAGQAGRLPPDPVGPSTAQMSG